MTFASVFLSTALLSSSPPATVSAPEIGTTAEHIEVFRQILRKRLARSGVNPFYRPMSGTLTVAQPEQNFLASNLIDYVGPHSGPAVEGVQLPGYGLVFTTTLPASMRDEKATDDKPAADALSDWDRAQAELRGERMAAVAPAETRSPSVRDSVLRVLADNGHHFSGLANSERVTIVITFRDGGYTSGLSAFGQNSALLPAMVGTVAPLTTRPASGNAPAKSATPSSARDYEALADLHLKQQQYQAALDAYSKAAAAYKEEGRTDGDDPVKALASLYSRQAQAQLGLGRNDEAMRYLRLAQGAQPAPTTAKTKEPKKSNFPTRLIITATKQQLNQVAQGQLSFEDFKKTASVSGE